MSTSSQTTEQAGFTLVELLVAMTILVLIASLLLGGMQFGTRVWETSQEATSASAEHRATRQLLAELLRQSYPYFHDTSQSAGSPPFVGERDEVLFSAEAPPQFAIKGLHRFHLRYEPIGEGRVQLLWVIDRNGKIDPRYVDGAARRTLLTNVSEFTLSYFDGKDWGERWNAKTSLPELVRLEIEFSDTKRHWVPLIIHPRIDMDSQCKYDPVSRRCRRR